MRLSAQSHSHLGSLHSHLFDDDGSPLDFDSASDPLSPEPVAASRSRGPGRQLPVEIIHRIAIFVSDFHLYARFCLISRAWRDIGLEVLGKRTKLLLLRGRTMDLASLICSLRRGGKIAGTMSEYGQFLKNVGRGTVFADKRCLITALKPLAKELKNSAKPLLEREADLGNLLLELKDHVDLPSLVETIFHTPSTLPLSQSAIREVSIGRVLARCRGNFTGEVIWRITEVVLKTQHLSTEVPTVQAEIAIAGRLSDEDLFSILRATVGSAIDETVVLLVKTLNHLVMRHSQTILSSARLSSRVAYAIGAAISIFTLKPESIAAVLFSLEVPTEELRAMLFWDLPVSDNVRVGVILHFERWQDKLTSWNEWIASRFAFAREMVHTSRGMRLLQQIDWSATTNIALMLAYLASGHAQLVWGRPTPPLPVVHFLAPVYGFPHDQEEQAVKALIQLKIDSQKLPLVKPVRTSRLYDPWTEEFCARVWMELIATDFVQASNLATVFAREAEVEMKEELARRAWRHPPIRRGLPSVVIDWDAFTKAEEVSGTDHIINEGLAFHELDQKIPAICRIRRDIVCEVFKSFWTQLAHKHDPNDLLSFFAINRSIVAVSPEETLAVGIAICPDPKGDLWNSTKTLVQYRGGSSAINELRKAVCRVHGNDSTSRASKISKQHLPERHVGLSETTVVSDSTLDVRKQNPKSARRSRRHRHNAESDLESRDGLSDEPSAEDDPFNPVNPEQRVRQKKERSKMAKVTRERRQARESKGTTMRDQ